MEALIIPRTSLTREKQPIPRRKRTHRIDSFNNAREENDHHKAAASSQAIDHKPSKLMAANSSAMHAACNRKRLTTAASLKSQVEALICIKAKNDGFNVL